MIKFCFTTLNINLIIGNFQLQDEYLCHFHFEYVGLKCEMTITPLDGSWGMIEFYQSTIMILLGTCSSLDSG